MNMYQRQYYNYYNLKKKLLTTNANIYFNHQCRIIYGSFDCDLTQGLFNHNLNKEI